MIYTGCGRGIASMPGFASTLYADNVTGQMFQALQAFYAFSGVSYVSKASHIEQTRSPHHNLDISGQLNPRSTSKYLICMSWIILPGGGGRIICKTYGMFPRWSVRLMSYTTSHTGTSACSHSAHGNCTTRIEKGKKLIAVELRGFTSSYICT